MTTPPRYPLAWPIGRPRTKNRRVGSFQMKDEAQPRYQARKPIDLATALGRLEYELKRMGAKNTVLSTDYEVRLNGSLVLNRGAPADPGVVVYFSLDGKPFNLPCDTFTETVQNIAALAAHLKATRDIERYGVATGSETLQAFQALPPPGGGVPVASWRGVLGFAPDFGGAITAEMSLVLVRDAYRKLAKEAAADETQLRTLNLARDAAVQEFTGGVS